MCRGWRYRLLHGVGVKVEPALRNASSLEGKGSSLGIDLGCQLGVLVILLSEVGVNNREGLLVDVEIVVCLQLMDLLHTTTILNIETVLVDTVGLLLVHLANLQDVLQTIQGNLDNLIVHANQDIAKGLDASLGNKVSDLVGLVQSSRGGVGDSPASLLLGLEVGVLENVDQRGDNVGVNDILNLNTGPCGDVGDGPASLLANVVLGAGEKGQQGLEGAAVNDNLSLNIITCDNVSDRTKSGSLDGRQVVHQQLDKTTADARLDNSLDLLIRAVREIGHGPAGVNQDFIITRVNQLGKDAQRGRNL